MSETMRNIGLGIILMKVRFSVSVAKVYNGFGFTTAMYVEMKNMTDHQRLAIQLWCDENDLPVKYRANRKDEIKAWVEALAPYESLLHDRSGYERTKWVLANPMPKSKSDEWSDFYEWVQRWDDYNENGELN
jgi:hypothetical protein